MDLFSVEPEDLCVVNTIVGTEGGALSRAPKCSNLIVADQRPGGHRATSSGAAHGLQPGRLRICRPGVRIVRINGILGSKRVVKIVSLEQQIKI